MSLSSTIVKCIRLHDIFNKLCCCYSLYCNVLRCVGFPVKLSTGQQVCLVAADMALSQVTMQTEESQCLSMLCMFFIIQEDMSRVAAGGGVCPCRADGGRPRGRSASEQVDRLEGRWGWNLDPLHRRRWRKQNNRTCCSRKVFIIFSNVDRSPGVPAFSAAHVSAH